MRSLIDCECTDQENSRLHVGTFTDGKSDDLLKSEKFHRKAGRTSKQASRDAQTAGGAIAVVF
jgi:hypothetical protein